MKKDNIFLISAAVLIILMVIFIVNINAIFPNSETNSIAGKISLKNINYTPNPDAKVTIIEYSDFECPFCASASGTVEQILAEYGNKVNFQFKHFRYLYTVHADSEKAAEASECARDQGKFFEYHFILFENQGAFSAKNLKNYAEQLGLNTEEFNKCLDSGEKENKVQQDFKEGIDAGVEETPTFFVNGQKVVGAMPFSQFKEIIDEELSK